MSAFDNPPPGAKRAPSTARNRDAIWAALAPRLPATGLVLEIASGAGEHAVYLAARLPGVQWLPTDADPEAIASIEAWRVHTAADNVRPPLRLDATDPDQWPIRAADALVCINMIHIAPWSAAEGLMKGAGSLLRSGGGLFLYGPFRERGVETAPSNEVFDESLKRRNPAWGLRQVEDIVALANANGIDLIERVEMPANNLVLVLRRR